MKWLERLHRGELPTLGFTLSVGDVEHYEAWLGANESWKLKPLIKGLKGYSGVGNDSLGNAIRKMKVV